MTWDKPKKLGQWLLLVSPPGIIVLATAAGGLLDPKGGDWMAWGLMGLAFATLLSFAISLWVCRVNPTMGGKLGVAFVCFVILMIINVTVSFAGCAAGSNMGLPGMSFH